MSSLLKNPVLRKVAAGVVAKEIIERVQEARAPRKSFIRRNLGKIAVIGLAGGAFYIYQRSKLTPALPSQRPYEPPQRREPAIEPGERLETPLRAPETTINTESPAPAGR